jgi:biopolymer transport protein ExbD
MAMSTGGGQGLTNEINVTPMIDVLLVLLIIFMMIIPLMRKAVDIQLPDPSPPPVQSTPDPNQIVLQIMPDKSYKINSEALPADTAALRRRLKDIYDPRPEKIMFLKGDGTLKYQDVITAMDIARGAGVKVIGVPPKS